jgi:drug/metabolite transporter (DMT)-like permease
MHKKRWMQGQKLRGAVAVFIGAASFGVLSTIVKKAYAQGYSLGEVTGIQALIGALILWTLVLLKGLVSSSSKNCGGKRGEWRKMIIVGTSSGIVSLSYYQCVKLLPASIAIILLMQYIWISVLLELLIFRKKPKRIQIFSIICVLTGTSFASGLFSSEIQALNWHGALYGFAAAASYAGFLFINGRIGNQLSPTYKSALMVTGACLLIFSIFPPGFIFDGSLSSGLLLPGLLLALFGTVVPPLFFAYGMPKAGVTSGAILSSAELPVAVLMSYTILREPVSPLQWIGVIIILASIILPRFSLDC